MMLNTDDKLINIIYAGKTAFSGKLKAFLEASELASFSQDIFENMPTDTQWHDFAKILDVSLKSFMNTEIIDDFSDTDNYTEEGLVKILVNNPEVLKGAIVIKGEKIVHITNYTKLLAFFEVDSAGLEKTMQTDNVVTQAKTDKDTFI